MYIMKNNNKNHVSSKKLARTSACMEWCWAAQEKLLIKLLITYLALRFESLTPTYSSLSLICRGDIPRTLFFFFSTGSLMLHFEYRTGAHAPD